MEEVDGQELSRRVSEHRESTLYIINGILWGIPFLNILFGLSFVYFTIINIRVYAKYPSREYAKLLVLIILFTPFCFCGLGFAFIGGIAFGIVMQFVGGWAFARLINRFGFRQTTLGSGV
jgi:hypothetical protein